VIWPWQHREPGRTSRCDQGEIDYLRLALAFGATHAIAKPFRPAELIALVRTCLAAVEARPP
jgi:hypothetical protein